MREPLQVPAFIALDLCFIAVASLIAAFTTSIAALLIDAALFLVVIQFAHRNGLHHPALPRRWTSESRGALTSSVASCAESVGGWH
ncbi:MAG: hypothetical protein WA621_19010 [Candidatus Acidiferrum sp.]